MFRRICCIILSITISLGPSLVEAQVLTHTLPQPGSLVSLSAPLKPTLLKGITLDPDQPFQFDFLIEAGDESDSEEQLKTSSEQFAHYFLAALALPEDQLWVNLAPQESGRIMHDDMAQTQAGRVMLEQDYLLKQLTASLMHPDHPSGKRLWQRLYEQVYVHGGHIEGALDDLHKIWIKPDKARVFEGNQTAYIVESRLKVELGRHDTSGMMADNERTHLLKEIILPIVEEEVNTGAHFAPLRQLYHAIILASWYKQHLKQAILTQVYADQSQAQGIQLEPLDLRDAIYNQYMEAFRTGAVDLIKEEYDPKHNAVIPRRYFAGGLGLATRVDVFSDAGQLAGLDLNLSAGIYRSRFTVGHDQDDFSVDKGRDTSMGTTTLPQNVNDQQIRSAIATIARVFSKNPKQGIMKFQFGSALAKNFLIDLLEEIEWQQYSSDTRDSVEVNLISSENWKQAELIKVNKAYLLLQLQSTLNKQFPQEDVNILSVTDALALVSTVNNLLSSIQTKKIYSPKLTSMPLKSAKRFAVIKYASTVYKGMTIKADGRKVWVDYGGAQNFYDNMISILEGLRDQLPRRVVLKDLVRDGIFLKESRTSIVRVYITTKKSGQQQTYDLIAVQTAADKISGLDLESDLKRVTIQIPEPKEVVIEAELITEYNSHYSSEALKGFVEKATRFNQKEMLLLLVDHFTLEKDVKPTLRQVDVMSALLTRWGWGGVVYANKATGQTAIDIRRSSVVNKSYEEEKGVLSIAMARESILLTLQMMLIHNAAKIEPASKAPIINLKNLKVHAAHVIDFLKETEDLIRLEHQDGLLIRQFHTMDPTRRAVIVAVLLSMHEEVSIDWQSDQTREHLLIQSKKGEAVVALKARVLDKFNNWKTVLSALLSDQTMETNESSIRQTAARVIQHTLNTQKGVDQLQFVFPDQESVGFFTTVLYDIDMPFEVLSDEYTVHIKTNDILYHENLVVRYFIKQVVLAVLLQTHFSTHYPNEELVVMPSDEYFKFIMAIDQIKNLMHENDRTDSSVVVKISNSFWKAVMLYLDRLYPDMQISVVNPATLSVTYHGEEAPSEKILSLLSDLRRHIPLARLIVDWRDLSSLVHQHHDVARYSFLEHGQRVTHTLAAVTTFHDSIMGYDVDQQQYITLSFPNLPEAYLSVAPISKLNAYWSDEQWDAIKKAAELKSKKEILKKMARDLTFKDSTPRYEGGVGVARRILRDMGWGDLIPDESSARIDISRSNIYDQFDGKRNMVANALLLNLQVYYHHLKRQSGGPARIVRLEIFEELNSALNALRDRLSTVKVKEQYAQFLIFRSHLSFYQRSVLIAMLADHNLPFTLSLNFKGDFVVNSKDKADKAPDAHRMLLDVLDQWAEAFNDESMESKEVFMRQSVAHSILNTFQTQEAYDVLAFSFEDQAGQEFFTTMLQEIGVAWHVDAPTSSVVRVDLNQRLLNSGFDQRFVSRLVLMMLMQQYLKEHYASDNLVIVSTHNYFNLIYSMDQIYLTSEKHTHEDGLTIYTSTPFMKSILLYFQRQEPSLTVDFQKKNKIRVVPSSDVTVKDGMRQALERLRGIFLRSRKVTQWQQLGPLEGSRYDLARYRYTDRHGQVHHKILTAISTVDDTLLGFDVESNAFVAIDLPRLSTEGIDVEPLLLIDDVLTPEAIDALDPIRTMQYAKRTVRKVAQGLINRKALVQNEGFIKSASNILSVIGWPEVMTTQTPYQMDAARSYRMSSFQTTPEVIKDAIRISLQRHYYSFSMNPGERRDLFSRDIMGSLQGGMESLMTTLEDYDIENSVDTAWLEDEQGALLNPLMSTVDDAVWQEVEDLTNNADVFELLLHWASLDDNERSVLIALATDLNASLSFRLDGPTLVIRSQNDGENAAVVRTLLINTLNRWLDDFDGVANQDHTMEVVGGIDFNKDQLNITTITSSAGGVVMHVDEALLDSMKQQSVADFVPTMVFFEKISSLKPLLGLAR